MSDEQKSELPQIVAEVSPVVVGETSSSPAKLMFILQNVPMSSECVTSGVVEKDQVLTVTENDCVITSVEEHMKDLNKFV